MMMIPSLSRSTMTMIPALLRSVLPALIILVLPAVCGGEPLIVLSENDQLRNSTGNHTDPSISPREEIAQNIMGFTLIGIVVLMFFFSVCTFGKSVCIGCKNCCTAFSRHGCKGCCRYMTGRRPEGGGEEAGGGSGILNEIIFDPDEQQQVGGESDLARGLLSDA